MTASDYPKTLRADCQYCGAKRETECSSATEFKAAALAWLREHRPCAGRQPSIATMTVQESRTSPAIPVFVEPIGRRS